MSSVSQQGSNKGRPVLNKQDIEVGNELMRYVLGRNNENLNQLRTTYPNIRIAANRDTIFISSPENIDTCVKAVQVLISGAGTTKTEMEFKRRLQKEKESRRRTIQAANKIRENIEAEIKQKHREDLEAKLAKSNGKGGDASSEDEVDDAVFNRNNPFARLITSSD
jgi:hypothetical protein